MTRSRNRGLAVVAIVGAALIAAVFLLRDTPAVEERAPRVDTAAAKPPSGKPAGFGAAIVDEPAPDFSLATLDGDTLSMADLKGQVVVVNFWATWCAPCRVEIPDLIEMQELLRDEGVRFVGISLDIDDAEAVRAFADDAEFNYPIVFADGDVDEDFGGIYALPTTVLIDRNGTIVRKIPGLVTSSLLMPLLKDLAES